MRPVLGSIRPSSISLKPFLSFETSRYSSNEATIGWLAGELLQLGGVRGIAGFDFSGFRQSQFFEKNALQLQVGVDVELFAGELLNRLLQADHFLSEVRVQLIEIVAIDENAGVLHAREHRDQGKLESRRKLPGALRAEFLLDDRRHGADRHGFPAYALLFIRVKRQRALLTGLRLALFANRG